MYRQSKERVSEPDSKPSSGEILDANQTPTSFCIFDKLPKKEQSIEVTMDKTHFLSTINSMMMVRDVLART